MNRFIYLDHAATTNIKKEVLDKMEPYLYENFGNPSSIYELGRNNRVAIEGSRSEVALAINSLAEEIYFTSCGTEADNWAIKGICFANKSKGNHIITSSIEHPAVKKTCEYMEQLGFEVTYLPVNEYGVISIKEPENSIKESTILISIMFANNEVGTIQPIKEIGTIARERNIYFHTDAVQAIGNIDIDVNKYNIDLLSLSAHKFYGPKGIEALYIRNEIEIDPLIHGGSQEHGKKSGTENVSGIIGMGKAIELSTKNIRIKNSKIIEVRNKFIQDVYDHIPNSSLNSHPIESLPGIVNIEFKDIDARFIVSMLDQNGIFVSNGSACSCRSENSSHVLLAMGKFENTALSSLRFSFGEENTKEEVSDVIKILSKEIFNYRNNL